MYIREGLLVLLDVYRCGAARPRKEETAIHVDDRRSVIGYVSSSVSISVYGGTIGIGFVNPTKLRGSLLLIGNPRSTSLFPSSFYLHPCDC